MAFYYSRSARETENIGFSLAKTVEVGSVVALFGELGAGKTAFVRGIPHPLCDGGYRDNEYRA